MYHFLLPNISYISLCSQNQAFWIFFCLFNSVSRILIFQFPGLVSVNLPSNAEVNFVRKKLKMLSTRDYSILCWKINPSGEISCFSTASTQTRREITYIDAVLSGNYLFLLIKPQNESVHIISIQNMLT